MTDFNFKPDEWYDLGSLEPILKLKRKTLLNYISGTGRRRRVKGGIIHLKAKYVGNKWLVSGYALNEFFSEIN